jgi:multiple sugar transport system permease protein
MRRLRALEPLAWVGPAVVLIAVVVLWPVVEMIRSSFLQISRVGIVRGFNGLDNYNKLFAEKDFADVMVRSVIWVVAVVALTVLISLALAQLFNQRFPGRKVARWALIAPWAASVLMTAIVFKWMLDPEVGVINQIRLKLGLIDAMGGAAADQLGDASTAMPWLVFVAVFVSVPFTTYALLAGLATIPADVYEAARMDGANVGHIYWRITLPLLRPALLVATVLNIIYVFNSFPIVYTLNDRNPGFTHDTTITFMYKLAFKSAEKSVGMSAAAGVFNVLLILVVVVVYLRTVKWQEEPA